jgi:hypothetical protein
MPRYSINLDPFQRPTSTAGDALTTAVAQVTAAIEKRRMMEADRDERDLERAERRADRQQVLSRQERLDALSLEDRDRRNKMDDRRLTLEDEDRGIRSQDRQLRIEREATQDQRTADRDAIDLFKLNEDLDYRDQQAAERQIQNMNIEDARRDASEARNQPKRMSFKDARALALNEAKARTGRDALGNARPVDPALLDQLTDEFLQQGEAVRPNQRVADPEVQEKVFDLLNPPTAAAGKPAPAAPAAPAAAPVDEPGILSRIGDFLNPFKGGGGVAPRDASQAIAPKAAPQDGQPMQAATSPNVVDPDPQYIDQMEQLSAANPENFKQILRELKAKHPEEYAATVRMLTERESAKRSVASAQ